MTYINQGCEVGHTPFPSDRRQDTAHQAGIDLANHSRVHISYLEQVVELRITSSSTAIDDLPNHPILVLLLPDLVITPHDHCHPWSDSQKERPFWLLRAVDPVINRHFPKLGRQY